MSAKKSSEVAGAEPQLKPLFWIASSRDDLRSFPDDVKPVLCTFWMPFRISRRRESGRRKAKSTASRNDSLLRQTITRNGARHN
jgi:hypothetical protein